MFTLASELLGRAALLAALSIVLSLTPAAVSQHSLMAADGRNPIKISENGFVAELIAVGCEDESPSWWTPSGEPLDERPYDEARGGTVHAEGRRVQFVLQILRRDATDTIRLSIPGARATQEGTASTPGGVPLTVFTAVLPPEVREAQLVISRSSGPWSKSLEMKGTSLAAMSNNVTALAVTPPTGDATQTVLHASIGLEANDFDYRLVASDKAGDLHPHSSMSSASAGSRHRAAIAVAEFAGLPLDQYDGVQLQTRPYKKYEINGIAAEPNQ